MTVVDRCDCDCHRDPNVRHIMRCCNQPPADAGVDPLPLLQARRIAGQDALPEEGAYIIVFEDAEVLDERFVGAGAKDAALRRYDMISMNWNAHLYVKIDSNHRDCTVPNALVAAAHAQVAGFAGEMEGG